jgi:protein arginine kinase
MGKTNLPPFLFEHTPWENEVNPIWPASSFILHRNLANFNFPNKENETQSMHTLEIVKQGLLKCPECQSAQFLQADQLTPLDKEFLVEHFLRLDSFQNTFAGQGFIVDPSAHFLATLNIEDHLQLQFVDCKGEWEKTWNHLVQIETQLSQEIQFAFSPTFGYLTADPGLCGTGLTTDVYLHLPALIHTGALEDALIKQKDQDVTAFGMEGNLAELIGDILILRNSYTLGLTEENILFSLNTSAMKLIVSEKTIRNQLLKDNSIEIKDQISRAFGLLVHSYQLKTKEALDALSLIKLGLDLGWIVGITDQKINEVFFKCRRARLALLSNEQQLDPHEVAKKRATFLHEQLAGMQLKAN